MRIPSSTEAPDVSHYNVIFACGSTKANNSFALQRYFCLRLNESKQQLKRRSVMSLAIDNHRLLNGEMDSPLWSGCSELYCTSTSAFGELAPGVDLQWNSVWSWIGSFDVEIQVACSLIDRSGCLIFHRIERIGILFAADIIVSWRDAFCLLLSLAIIVRFVPQRWFC